MAEDEGKKRLPSRATRGLRMSKLMGEELEADEDFWGQDFFKEEKEDVDFDLSKSSEEESESDSSMVEPDQEHDDDEEESTVEPEKKKRKPNRYKDNRKKPQAPPKVELKTEKDGEPSLPLASQSEAAPVPKKQPSHHKKQEKLERRKSARKICMKQNEEREERMKKTKVHKKKQPQEVITYTQEQMLEEAKITEQYNLACLENMLLQEEEEQRRKAHSASQAKYSGPLEIFHSTKDGDFIIFENMDIPSHLTGTAPPAPEKLVCSVTNKPARYLDPKSHQAYANAEAFKLIRERLAKEEEEKYNQRLSELNAILEEKKKKKLEYNVIKMKFTGSADA